MTKIGLVERMEKLDSELNNKQYNQGVWDVYNYYHSLVRNTIGTRYIENVTRNPHYSNLMMGRDIRTEDWMHFLMDARCWQGMQVRRLVIMNNYLDDMSKVIHF